MRQAREIRYVPNLSPSNTPYAHQELQEGTSATEMCSMLHVTWNTEQVSQPPRLGATSGSACPCPSDETRMALKCTKPDGPDVQWRMAPQ